MKRHWLLFLFAILLPLTALATSYTTDGVGGGGWLYAGAINSNNPDIMVVGSDMAGVHRSTNGGLTWLPWNTGIPDGDFRYTSYVQDLLYVDSPIWSGFFAASVGGAMRAQDGANWEHITPPEDYHYFMDDNLEEPWPYPFSSLAFDGVDTVYIGAGLNRWDSSISTYSNASLAYPQLYWSFSGSTHGDAQYTVWSYDLTTGGPLEPLTTVGNQFGAARDISARQIDGKDYVVVTTSTGIWLHDGSEWIDLSENVQLYYMGQDRGTALDAGWSGYLSPWGAHITARGSLYISTYRNETYDLYPGGVYRIFDITADLADMRFQWVGNDVKLPPNNWGIGALSLREYCFNADNYAGHFIYMSVLDGVGDAPEEIYVGDRKSKYGLFRIHQDYLDEELSCTVKHCAWAIWESGVTTVYSDPDNDTDGDYVPIDEGWEDYWGSQVLFKPALAATPEGTRVLLQFSVRLHVSNDSGETFVNSYCTEAAEGANVWRSKGYNELAVMDIAFGEDSRLLFGAGDVGNFYEDGTYDSYYEHLNIPLVVDNDSDGEWDDMDSNDEPDLATNEDDYAWERDGGYVATVPDWRKTGHTALFVEKGNQDGSTAPSKLFMRHPDVYDGEWKNITSTLEYLDHYRFGDLIVFKDNTIFMAYKKYSERYIGQDWYSVVDRAVLKGVFDPKTETWTWEELSDGIVTAEYPKGLTVFQLLYNSFSGRIFAATEGGLFVLEDVRDDDWEKVPIEVIPYEYSYIWSLAQSEKGKEIFAGTSSGSDPDYSKTATLLKCTNPNADIADMQWEPLVNTSPDDYDFEFGDPYCLLSEMEGRADEKLPKLRALAVRPGTDDTLFVGIDVWTKPNAAFMVQEGVWVYNRRDCGVWENISLGTTMEGVAVRSLAFDPNDSSRLYVATDGLGVQVLDVSSLPSISCTPEKPGKNPHDPGLPEE